MLFSQLCIHGYRSLWDCLKKHSDHFSVWHFGSLNAWKEADEWDKCTHKSIWPCVPNFQKNIGYPGVFHKTVDCFMQTEMQRCHLKLKRNEESASIPHFSQEQIIHIGGGHCSICFLLCPWDLSGALCSIVTAVYNHLKVLKFPLFVYMSFTYEGTLMDQNILYIL